MGTGPRRFRAEAPPLAGGEGTGACSARRVATGSLRTRPPDADMDLADQPSRVPPDPPPRGLLIVAAGWILLSLLVAFGPSPPILPLASSYAPAIRVAVLAMAAGLVIAWPLLRLSLPARRWPRRGVLLDSVVLLGAVQVSIWPMRLAAGWAIDRTLAIDACLCGWTLLAGTVCLWGARSDGRSARTAAMATLLALLLLPAALAAAVADDLAAGLANPFVVASEPFLAIHRLADPAPRVLSEADRLAAALPLVAGLLAFTASLPFTGPPRRA